MTVTEFEGRILERLKAGPMYLRTFHKNRAVLDRIIAKGLAEQVAPIGGKARNMVKLTSAGRDMLGLGPEIAFDEHMGTARRLTECVIDGKVVRVGDRVPLPERKLVVLPSRNADDPARGPARAFHNGKGKP